MMVCNDLPVYAEEDVPDQETINETDADKSTSEELIIEQELSDEFDGPEIGNYEPSEEAASSEETEELPSDSDEVSADEEVPEEIMISEEDKEDNEEIGQYDAEESVQLYSAEASETALTQLAAPANLRWNNKFGNLCFDLGDPTQNHYRVSIFCNDSRIYGESFQLPLSYSRDYFTQPVFSVNGMDITSGDIYFTVQSLGDGIQYSDSEISRSEVYHYVKPDNSIPAASDVAYDGEYISFKLSEKNRDMISGMQIYIVYKSSAESDDAKVVYSMDQGTFDTDTDETIKIKVGNFFLNYAGTGSGYYGVTFRLLSKDIESVFQSEWSEYSNFVYMHKGEIEINNDLDNLIGNTEMSAEEIRKAVQQLDTDELVYAMNNDSDNTDTVAKMKELESRLGTSSVEVTDEMKSVFDETDITMVGGLFNTPENTGEDIKLVVSRAQYDDVIPTLYNSTMAVKFSMELDNVQNTDKLQVPVKISIPVPETINPDFLVILHYHINGESPAEIHPFIYTENGKKYATFTLTSFSDFVMTEPESSVITEISFPESEVIMIPGETNSINVNFLPSDTARNAVGWNSSNQNAAVVDEYGSVTAVSPGKTVITASYGSVSAECLVTVLFKDVTDPNQFYYEYIYWMADEGITTGYSDGTYGLYKECNRAAVVTFLWRLAGKPEPKKTAKFKDMTGNADFDKAISWASEEGITTGWEDNTFRPWNTCNRAAIMTFLWRYAGKPEVKVSEAFSDMTGNGDFDKAISWGIENGITTGWDDGTFRPWRTCNRLAIASFLGRYKRLTEK